VVKVVGSDLITRFNIIGFGLEDIFKLPPKGVGFGSKSDSRLLGLTFSKIY
jgi:hypothetical protein